MNGHVEETTINRIAPRQLTNATFIRAQLIIRVDFRQDLAPDLFDLGNGNIRTSNILPNKLPRRLLVA